MKDLIKVARKLEGLGLAKEASALGAIIRKIGGEIDEFGQTEPDNKSMEESAARNKERVISDLSMEVNDAFNAFGAMRPSDIRDLLLDVVKTELDHLVEHYAGPSYSQYYDKS
jgi:hypothetical protein